LNKLLEIIELCKKMAKSTPAETVQDRMYKILDGSVSSISKKTTVKTPEIKMPEAPKLPGTSIPTGSRQKNKIGNSEV
jgi:hypothetical protein